MLNFSVFMILDSPFFWAHWFLKSVWVLISLWSLVEDLLALGICGHVASELQAWMWMQHCGKSTGLRLDGGGFSPALNRKTFCFRWLLICRRVQKSWETSVKPGNRSWHYFLPGKLGGWNRLVFSEAPAQSSAVMTGLYTFHGKRFHARPVGISEGLLETWFCNMKLQR